MDGEIKMIDNDRSNTVNIEEILADIRREITEKGYTNDTLSFNNFFDIDKINVNIQDLYKKRDILLYYPIHGNPLKVIIKRTIRKATKFLLEPIVFNQNNLNYSTTDFIRQIMGHIELINNEIKKLNEKITALEKKIK
jgi:hypothetical protein